MSNRQLDGGATPVDYEMQQAMNRGLERKAHAAGTKATGVACYEKAADDEPLFVLRGTDPATPNAIRAWAAEAMMVGHRQEKVDGALEHADEIERWQLANADRVKRPS